jgi:hypothetical protein
MVDDEILRNLLALSVERAIGFQTRYEEGKASAGENHHEKHANLEYSSTVCRTNPSGQQED